MIKKSEELDFSNKKISMIIAGVPGIGKTTLAFSAPKPLLLDLDKGISRVEAIFRKDIDEVENMEELRKDLSENDLTEYETIVIDTGGRLLDLMKPEVIKNDPLCQKKNGDLSLQGYGVIKKKFNEFVKYVKENLKKNLVIVFHAKEIDLKHDDMTGLRIRIEGATKDEIWDSMDLGGFIEMNGDKRTICFQNNDRFFAKGAHGISGTFIIPKLTTATQNTFLTDIFQTYKTNLQEEIKQLNQYNAIIAKFTPEINNLSTLKKANAILAEIKNTEHQLTSKEELWAKLNRTAKKLGFIYDKGNNAFIIDNTKSA